MRYRRFVAIGDSYTEGLDDPYPDGASYRGWADLVATRLAEDEPGLSYANLGVRGRRLDQIIDEQIPTVTRLRPDLVALFGGGNDVLSSGFDAQVVGRRVRIALRALTDAAPTVVVFTLSDLSGRVPMVRRLRPRMQSLNESIRQAADDYGALLVDLWPDEAVRDLRYFGPDRLHLGEHGHRRLAAHLLTKLDVPCDPTWGQLAGVPVTMGLGAHAGWVWRQVLPAVTTRLRRRMAGRATEHEYLPKRPELLPVSVDV
jgi:lysophospholipase L1-like esterase